MSTASSEISSMNGLPFQNIMDKFRNQCEEYFDSEIKKRFFTSSQLNKTITNHYLTEYQRCIDEQNHFENYIHEQMNSLESLKSFETTIDSFVERLKTIHDYESKQNEVFEQILHELTKMVRFIWILLREKTKFIFDIRFLLESIE